MPLSGFPPDWGLSPLLRDVPFYTRDDVLAITPQWMRDDDSLIRDSIADALLKTMAIYCSYCASYAGETDPQYSDDGELDYLGDQRGIPRAQDESDTVYRNRVLNDDSIATPAAIMAAVKAILLPLTSIDPYYFELADDEIYIYANDLGNTDDGFFIDCTVDPVECSWRRYEARGARRPQHGLMWGTFASATTRRTLSGDDYTDAFNAWGTAVIAVPPFRLPGASDQADAIIIDDLTDDSASIGGEMWTEASMEANTAIDLGSDVWTLGGDGALVVETISKMLSKRALFQADFVIMLDPSLQ